MNRGRRPTHTWFRVSSATLVGMCLLVWAIAVVPSVDAAKEPLTIHIVAHSHCDPGWLNTFQGYFDRDVRHILDGVYNNLMRDPTKRFVWAETSFFQLWFERQPQEVRENFRRLVHEGRLEFIGGGWVQNDEANPDLATVINQMTTGHEYLLKNFGVQPRIGWQIDPFGHSALTPSVWAMLGFDALVINRIHHLVKRQFKRNKHMEFIWRGVDMGVNTDMLTHVLHTHYSAPKGYDWEEGAPHITDRNVAQRSRSLVEQMRGRANAYRHNHLLVTFGDDFKFKRADVQFNNMDKIIKYVNGHSKELNARIQYSTVSEYFQAVNGVRPEVGFPTYTGDFYPYADNEDSYWTGYYTTRPLLKSLSRSTESLRAACEQLFVMVRHSERGHYLPGSVASETDGTKVLPAHWTELFKNLQKAREEGALMMHHDAITGTARENVVSDYINRMNDANRQLTSLLAKLMSQVIIKPLDSAQPGGGGGHASVHGTLPLQNDAFRLQIKDSQSVYPVFLHNPLAHQRVEIVRLRTTTPFVAVIASNGEHVVAQVDHVFRDKSDSPDKEMYSVSFAALVPAMGISTYTVKLMSTESLFNKYWTSVAEAGGSKTPLTARSRSVVYKKGAGGGVLGFIRGDSVAESHVSQTFAIKSLGSASEEEVSIGNDFLRIWISKSTGLPESIQQLKDGEPIGKERIRLDARFGEYSTSGSGAYIFRPRGSWSQINHKGELAVRICRGPLVQSVYVRHEDKSVNLWLPMLPSKELSGSARMSVQVSVSKNKEATLRFSTNIGNNFYTHNSVEFMKRDPNNRRPLPGKFYPAVSGVRMSTYNFKEGDGGKSGRQLTILNDHTMSCGLLNDNTFEFMIHRSLGQDDGRGLAQSVIDNNRITVNLRLMADAGGSELDFNSALVNFGHPVRLFSFVTSAAQKASHPGVRQLPQAMHQTADVQKHFYSSFSPIKGGGLPHYLHVFTLQARDSHSDDVMLRVQHLDKSRSSVARISLAEIFDPSLYKCSNLRRMSLSGIRQITGGVQASGRLKWKYANAKDEAMWAARAAANDHDEDIARQNTDEEGVFISQAALDKLAEDREQTGGGGGARTLLQLPAPEMSVVDISAQGVRRNPALWTSGDAGSARSLAGFDDLYVRISPGQLQTYLLHMAPKFGATIVDAGWDFTPVDVKNSVKETPVVEAPPVEVIPPVKTDEPPAYTPPVRVETPPPSRTDADTSASPRVSDHGHADEYGHHEMRVRIGSETYVSHTAHDGEFLPFISYNPAMPSRLEHFFIVTCMLFMAGLYVVCLRKGTCAARSSRKLRPRDGSTQSLLGTPSPANLYTPSPVLTSGQRQRRSGAGPGSAVELRTPPSRHDAIFDTTPVLYKKPV